MATLQTSPAMAQQAYDRLKLVRRLMDTQAQHTVYAIVDAAADEQLYGWLKLEPQESEVMCLYDGDPAIRYGRYAPYLMTLHDTSPLFWRWTQQGWNKSWGIWFSSDSTSDKIKRHFKKYLTFVHQGKTAYLRFYDPRVLPVLLPAMTPGNCFDFFGGALIHSYGALQTPTGALWQATAVQDSLLQKSTNCARPVSRVINLSYSS